MRFAIKTNPQHTTWEAILETWQRADDVDLLESAWLFDHFYPIHGDTDGPCLEAWTALAALAQATERIRVGTMVNGMPYRHPAVTANMAATLDIVSAGRFELGLGAGWFDLEADAYGISLGSSVGERMDMFDEGVEVIHSLLSNEHTTFAGTHYQLTEARCEPKGPQQPHPPLTLGGGGERRTLRTVARFADHWNVMPGDLATWTHKRDVLERHCADVGRDPAEITRSIMLRFTPGGDPAELTRQVEQYAEAGVDLFVVNLPSPHDPDHVDELVGMLAPLSP